MYVKDSLLYCRAVLGRLRYFKLPFGVLTCCTLVCFAALYLAPYFYPAVNNLGEAVRRNSNADINFDVRLWYVKTWLFRFYCVRFGWLWTFWGVVIREVHIIPQNLTPRLRLLRLTITFTAGYVLKGIFLAPSTSFLLYLHFFGI